MKVVHFYISNPNHHWQMMKTIVKELDRAIVSPVVVSLCELRRMQSPTDEATALGVIIRVMGSLKVKGASTSSGKKYVGGNQAFLRNLLRGVFWRMKVLPQLKEINATAPNLVVVPNDIAYPFDKICRWLAKKKIPFVLLQEGIRFPLPNEKGQLPYGSNGAKEIFAWGEHSALYFKAIGVTSTITAAGNPRFDDFFNRVKNQEPGRLLPLGTYNILYVSNPIDDQGFCSHETKILLFSKFVKGISGLMLNKGLKVFVRLHPREDSDSFKRAVPNEIKAYVEWAQAYELFDCIRQTQLTVVLASTVGLEAMMMGAPVGVIKLPEHGYIFDYVSSGSAVALDLDDDFGEQVWQAITERTQELKGRSSEFVSNQLSNRGNSASFIAERLLTLIN